MHKARLHMVQLNKSLHIEPKQNEQNMTFESTWTFQGAQAKLGMEIMEETKVITN